ncbi:hypothetical protein H312_01077 [Anncaliia algerae PRA339]|uniref:Uncharacterized protein n=1 Tax=Anncaliia algerae PRA339 TaxID=1288291 RepID=A0A059F3D2_9MICR|nr:hypothetical protein H312_01077 [Anncaliia algerae PRA339]
MISDEFERKIVKMNITELLTYLMNENYLKEKCNM